MISVYSTPMKCVSIDSGISSNKKHMLAKITALDDKTCKNINYVILAYDSLAEYVASAMAVGSMFTFRGVAQNVDGEIQFIAKGIAII